MPTFARAFRALLRAVRGIERRHVAAFVVLAAAAWLYDSATWFRFQRTWRAFAAIDAPLTRGLDAKRAAVAGDCDGDGVGYLARLSPRLPATGPFPLLVGHVPVLRPEVWLGRTWRSRLDDVVVALGVTAGELQPVALETVRLPAPAAVSLHRDPDRIEAFEVRLRGPGALEALDVDFRGDRRRLVPEPPRDDGTYRFAVVPPFESRKGRLRPESFTVRTVPPALDAALVVVGTRRTFDGYEVVEREGACFVAARPAFVAAARSDPAHPWHAYFAGGR